MAKKFDKVRLLFGLFLLPVVAIGSIIAHVIEIPAWPAFLVMIFFFMVQRDKKQIPNIMVGTAFGILMIYPMGILIKIFEGTFSTFTVGLVYILVFIIAIIVFGEMVPIILNNYAFLAMLVTIVEMGRPDRVHPLKLLAMEVVGGALFIGAILGIVKILTIIFTRKMAKAKAKQNA
jgi:hypothetical protein